ncbi:MAG: ThuA domain-containing protein [Armatimonadetes bacterium]|nr:ThuA domain-containing protein [Akkermansiaceae bacterium]
MKALIPASLVAAVALFVVAYNPHDEQAPAGAAEKIAAAMPAKAYAKPAKARKLLVFSRTNGFRHASIATGKVALAELGKKTGAYEAVISDELSNFEKQKIGEFDAICFLSTTQNPFSPTKEESDKMSEDDKAGAAKYEAEIKASLMSYVKNGGGFVGIHAATDTFYEWAEYGQMINGFFDGHPWGSGTRVSIKVEPGQEEHPLAKMFGGENIEFNEEIYQFKDPYDSSKVHMLLRLDPEKSDMNVQGLNREDKDWGVSWARNWEKGKVFYCSIGHNDEMYWNPKILNHYLAGIQWAMGDYKIKLDAGK